MKFRFALPTPKFFPFLEFQHVLMICLVVVVIFLSILLAGCSSYSAMTNIYILGLSYASSKVSNSQSGEEDVSKILQSLRGSSRLEVRIGYFGICVRQHGVIWVCGDDLNGLTQQIGASNDPLGLIGLASKFKDDVLFSGLLFMAIAFSTIVFFLLATFPGWHKERDNTTGSDIDVKPFPSRPVSFAAASCVSVSCILCLVSALWQHVGAVGASAMAMAANHGNIETQIGIVAIIFSWIGTISSIIVAIGLWIMILSITVLDRLTEND